MIDPERKGNMAAIKVAQSASIHDGARGPPWYSPSDCKTFRYPSSDQEDELLTGGELNDISDEEIRTYCWNLCIRSCVSRA